MDIERYSSLQILRWGAGGLALYIVLAILLWAGGIARDAERRAGEILLVEGHRWASVERYGRGMAIQGVAPSAAEGEAAVEAVAADWSVRRAWADFDVAGAAGAAGGDKQ